MRRCWLRGCVVADLQSLPREIFLPTADGRVHAERANDITSTEVSALFGLSPYETEFELWHRKRSGEDRALADDERRMRGRMFEPVIAEFLAERENWILRPMKEYVRVPALRIGSSFDFRIHADCSARHSHTGHDHPGDAILEIKRVNFLRFNDGWTVEDDGWTEAPAHIELQVQHQMLVSGLRRAAIGVDVAGRDETRVLWRDADDAVHAAIVERVAAFWASVEAGAPPDPTYPDDAAAVIAMHQFAEPGKLFDGSADVDLQALIAEYHAAGVAVARETDRKDSAKARILTHIGEAERVLVPGFSVSAGVSAPSEGTLVTADMVGTYVGARRAFRSFRVTQKKA